MKKLNSLLLSLLSVLSLQSVYAQEHKFPFKSGTLVLNEVSDFILEGYNGSEVVITVNAKPSIPDKAKGLSPINSEGIQENTGLGIAVNKTSNDTYQIHQILSEGKYTIRVPQDIKVKVMNEGNGGQEIRIKNLNSDLEISTRNTDINLENVSGPVLINTIRGNVVGKFNQKVNTPISIISMYGEVDVSLPENIQADLKLSSAHGNIFTDLPIEYAKNTEKSEPVKGISGSGGTSGGSSSISYSTGPTVTSGSQANATKAEATAYSLYSPKGSNSVALAPSVSGNQHYTVYVAGSAGSNKPATQVRGTVNGGGGEIQLESRNNNIYLRKF